MENRPPLLHIRPQFSSLVAILESLCVALAGTVALTFVGGILLLALFSLIGLGRFVSGGMLFTTLFVLGWAALPPMYYEAKRKAFQNTFYNFYGDYVEFQRFQYLVNRRIGRISYRDITNVAEHANFIQQREKLTSIYLFAPNMAPALNGEFPGIKLTDIPQSGDQIRKILGLIDQSNYPQAPAPLPEPVAVQGAQAG
ncbi:MAG: hypothetical protein V1721_01010 [Pseudomonadota bacterium]